MENLEQAIEKLSDKYLEDLEEIIGGNYTVYISLKPFQDMETTKRILSRKPLQKLGVGFPVKTQWIYIKATAPLLVEK